MKRLGHGVLWIVGMVIYIACTAWVVGAAGLDLTAGTDSITQRFASGKPEKIDLGRHTSARSIFVRADSPGTPKCVTNSPDAALEHRTGHDLTVDGTTWRRIYAVDSSLNKMTAEFRVTCRAGKGAEFALGRDRYWDGVLIFIVSLAALILLMVGGETLYRKRKSGRGGHGGRGGAKGRLVGPLRRQARLVDGAGEGQCASDAAFDLGDQSRRPGPCVDQPLRARVTAGR